MRVHSVSDEAKKIKLYDRMLLFPIKIIRSKTFLCLLSRQLKIRYQRSSSFFTFFVEIFIYFNDQNK